MHSERSADAELAENPPSAESDFIKLVHVDVPSDSEETDSSNYYSLNTHDLEESGKETD